MPTYTLTLDQDAHERVSQLTKIFGGTVPNFARSLTEEISKLPPNEIVILRQHIAERIRAANTLPTKRSAE